MKEIDNYKTKNRELLVATIVIVAIITWGLREIIFQSTGFGNRIIEIVYAVFIFVALFSMTYFLIYDEKGEKYDYNYYKYYIFLGAMEIIALLPFFTQKFMYGDDLWGFDNDFNGSIQAGLYFSRPFIGFLQGYVVNSDFLHIHDFRLFISIVQWLFGCSLFRLLYGVTDDKDKSFLMSVIAIASCIAADCVAYASVYPIVASLLLSTISFIIYEQTKMLDKRNKRIAMVISAIPLFLAFGMYQIGTPIVFCLYVIVEQSKREETEKKRFLQAFKYLVYYGCVALGYLLFTKFVQNLTGVQAGQSARAEIGTSISFYLKKITWFVGEVLPQTINRIVEIFTGNILFNENNMFYSVTYKSDRIKIICYCIVIIFVSISLIRNIIKSKSLWLAVIMLSAILLCFWPFIILPESTYLTYYAIALILLLTWFFIDGIYSIGSKYLADKVISAISYILIFIIVLQANNYSQCVWVNYNRDSYEYVANNIQVAINDNKEIETIAVHGNIGPYVGGREYVIMLVKDVLKELGHYSEDVIITQYDNMNYISIFNDNELEKMKEILGKEKTEKLLNFYMHDEMYSRWIFAGGELSEEDKDFLRENFIATGQIAQEDDHTIIIDLTGFNTRNSF